MLTCAGGNSLQSHGEQGELQVSSRVLLLAAPVHTPGRANVQLPRAPALCCLASVRSKIQPLMFSVSCFCTFNFPIKKHSAISPGDLNGSSQGCSSTHLNLRHVLHPQSHFQHNAGEPFWGITANRGLSKLVCVPDALTRHRDTGSSPIIRNPGRKVSVCIF